MSNLLVDKRDQEFILYEMLNIEEELCKRGPYSEFSRDEFDMTLDIAGRLAQEEIYPTMMEADREGCRLENGKVFVPRSFHKIKEKFIEGGWNLLSVSPEAGGQGFPYTMHLAVCEYFVHNYAFHSYIFLSVGAAHLIEKFGSDEQKKKYMEKMYTGLWGGSMALTEPDAGSDVGSLKTKAVKQTDGSYKITGSKIFITGAESDLFENIINPVLARIEGDPAGTKGISIFLVPKFIVNEDGSIGKRNDYSISGIEHKMGLRGSSTCSINFGDNGECYGELLGEERKGMKVMFQLMNEARIDVGLQGMGTAGAAYLHALKYASERKQGTSIMNMQNPEAPRVAIIEHPDVRRMLLWMKSNVEGMRALIYFSGICFDKIQILNEDHEEYEKWKGLLEILTPVCKAYCSDTGFRVTETAMQVYGGYGYCQDYPVEQFMRDLKIASIYEGTNGIQALDLVGRKLGQKKGKYFITLLSEMNKTVARFKDIKEIKDIADEMQTYINLLAETGIFFAKCSEKGKFLIPISNAYPFITMLGNICLAWLLFWQAGIASQKLASIYESNRIDPGDKERVNNFIADNREAAFYSGKLYSARYYIKNVLPLSESFAKAIKSEDLSVININNSSFSA